MFHEYSRLFFMLAEGVEMLDVSSWIMSEWNQGEDCFRFLGMLDECSLSNLSSNSWKFRELTFLKEAIHLNRQVAS